MSEGSVLSSVYKKCENVEVEYLADCIRVVSVMDQKTAGQLKSFIPLYDVVFGKEED